MHREHLLEDAFYLCTWDEPCSCSISWRFLVVELILALNDWKLAGLHIVLCGNTTVLEDWSISPWISSLSSSLEIILFTELLYLSGWLDVCRMHVDSTICFPCWRDANPASILTPCWIIGRETIAERDWNVLYWFRMKKNMDVRMYTWRIYSSRYLDTLLYKLELNMHWKCCSLYTLATIEEKGWDCSQMYNWHSVMNRITMKWEPVTYEN